MIRFAVVCSTCGYAKLTLDDLLAGNIRDAHVLQGHKARVIGRKPRRPELHTDLKREAK